MRVLGEVNKLCPSTMFILVTGFATLDSAVSALREGAYDYLTKPIDLEHLLSTTRRALEHRGLLLHNEQLIASLRETADALRQRTISLEQLHQEEQRKTKQLFQVNAIARQITAILDVDTLARTVADLIGPAFGFDSPSFGLVEGDLIRFLGGALDGLAQPLGESPFWALAQGGRALYVRDLEPSNPGLARDDSRFDLVFPLQAGHNTVGLWVANWQPDAVFRHEKLPYLESLAAQTVAVLENARLYALARRADELAFLNAVAQAANQSLDLKDTICGVLACVREAFRVSMVEIYVLDEGGEVESVFGLVHPGQQESRLLLRSSQASRLEADRGKERSGEGVRMGRPLLGLDFMRRVKSDVPLLCRRGDAGFPDRAWFALAPSALDSLQVVLGVSLRLGGRQIGMMGLGCETPDAFDVESVRLLQVVGRHVATAIENARLFREIESGRRVILESRNTLQALFDGIPDGIYIVDRHSQILAINRTQAEWANKPMDELVGRPADRASPDSAESLALIAETFERGVMQSRSERRRADSGQWTEWEIHTYPIFSSDGAPGEAGERDIDRVVVVVRDVTEQRWLEASLLQSEKLAAVGTLAAGLAHEINNPMTVVSANAQILREEIPVTHPYYSSVQLIDRASERASKIVRNLLDFSRSEEFECVPTDLNRSVTEALSLVETQFQKSGIKVVLKLAPYLPTISASPDHLHVVWLNLLLNARDAILDIRPEGRIRITSLLRGDWVEVHIADNGAGISDQQLNHLYEPFFTTKEPGKGTGLGLFTCYRTIARHGGKITVTSQADVGSIFHILLPVPSQ